MGTAALAKEKECAIAAALEAGAIIRSIYNTDYDVDYKGKDSPVTRADHEANHKIHDIIQGAFPHDGWLSEETVDSPARLSRQRVWVVDPMDGTKEFIRKIPEFAVSIALVDDGEPVLGVTYNPPTDQLYWAVRGQGAWYGAQRLQVTPCARLSDAMILSSRSETKRGEWDAFKNAFQTRPTGSIAYKLSVIACGEADASFTLVPKNEWDICAGVLILEEAGGQVSNLDGSRVVFNQPKTLLPGLVASNTSLHEQILQLIGPRQPISASGRK
jgi:myo-inositol-1(or 4)-monophosphatase